MGSDVSAHHKSRIGTSCDEGMDHRSRNNYHALRFHQVHGDYVKLSKNGTAAWRSEGFCKGLVFSDRPVMIHERVYIKFLDISSNWSGALRIGFTMNDPMSMKSKLPKYACPDLTSIHGNWAKAIAERLAKKDSILYYYVDLNGDVHYGIDSEEYGVFFGGVNTSGKLWAVLDIYGNTLDGASLDQDASSETFDLAALSRCIESGNRISDLDISNLNFNVSFHQLLGKNVSLKRNGTTVTRKTGCHNFAYAFTSQPFSINQNVVLKVMQTDHFHDGSFIYGITSCNPSSIDPSELPEIPDDLLDRPEYWVVKEDHDSYEVNDVIVFRFNSKGEITVTKNNENKHTSFHVDPTQTLWLFINLVGKISEVFFVGTSANDVVEDLSQNCEALNISPSSNADETAASSSKRSNRECVICYEESVNCVIYRCGHMCMCYECALKLWKPSSNEQCPICRETIQDIIKIY
ncbi:protein neuralized-like isoform X2 [Uloborus diversus]|uniref:protein neuralized-like isoform X2 n=1 Tax=Uloborus diversus TaxID=327109 RepID=UPI00240A4C0C|nr:protein neuralized-like isoform X2 [Uloborus diversus]